MALLDEVLRQDPEVIDAWFMLGTQSLATDIRESRPVLQEDAQLKPDYDIAVFNLAQAYRRMGDDDAALAGFEHYLTLDPKDPYVALPDG